MRVMAFPPLLIGYVLSLLVVSVESQVPPAFLAGNEVLEATATCDALQIYFRINFQRPFQGLIYTEKAFPECVYINGSTSPRMNYDVSIPLNGCLTRKISSGAWENTVIVQRDTRILEQSDRKYIINCLPSTSNSLDNQLTVSFGGVTVEGNVPATQVVSGSGGGGNPPALDYTVEVQSGLGPDSPLVSGPLSVGEPISYVIKLRSLDQQAGSDARIGKCWAEDGVSSIQLADDGGCSLQRTGQVWESFRSETRGTEKIFYNDIKAWAFPTSNRVDIMCNLHLCGGACPAPNCNRGRRNAELSIGDSADTLVPIRATFEVTSLSRVDLLKAEASPVPFAVVTGAPQKEEKYNIHENICIPRLYFGIGVSLFLLLLLLSLGVLLYLTARSRSRQTERKALTFVSPSWN